MISCHTQYLESRMNLFHEAKNVLDKDGKVNPLGPYGKMKLTGQEVANYFRKNKVSDAKVKRAVEVALDMSGAMDIASKEIKKFFGDKILKSKEVQNALRYANEETFKDDLNDLEEGSFYEETDLTENYRELAKHGMGAETKNSIKVGTEVDYYQKDGAKYMGKITKMTPKGYIVRDDKTKKDHEFTYHDRNAAKKLLQKKDKLSNIIKKNTIKKGKFAGYMTDEKNVMDTYREMWENGEKYAPQLDEEVANITVDPRNKISKSADQNKHAMAISKNAKRMGLKSSMMGKHVRIKGNKKAVNDFLRVVIGKSTYGDPTEKDMTTPQIDKMLNKDLK